VAPGAPYFQAEDGVPFTPLGQNDAVDWPELAGLYRRRDVEAVDRHLAHLRAHGVTCLRLMLEYAQGRHRYLERPAGRFVPNMVQYWDDLFRLCEKHGLRILLTPYDTFWMWQRWRWHPYNSARNGPLDHPSRLLTCKVTRAAMKARITFAAERWGGSGALFAWDLLNEIHPAHNGGRAENFCEFIHDMSTHLRQLECRLYGRSHLQTVSVFGPELDTRHGRTIAEAIFRHPDLDFATIHIYESRTIDWPRDTVKPALAVGRIVRNCLAEIADERPFLDSEHGPIHLFKDRKRTLPEPFDDEYFRHIQWAHFASGGAGGGMRWPNRHPHTLTLGMRQAQRSLAGFVDLVDWGSFRRVNLNEEITADAAKFAVFGCGDTEQAIAWLLRRDIRGPGGRLREEAEVSWTGINIPGLRDGRYRVNFWDTKSGRSAGVVEIASRGGLRIEAAVHTDLAVFARRLPA
jgi:mannan endo-1,4-beta-mannosidase